MNRRFARIFALVAVLTLAPTAHAQGATENPDATTDATTGADMRPNGSIVTLRGFMNEIRNLTNAHLEQSKLMTKAHITAVNNNLEHWKTIGASFVALFTLFGFAGLWSLFRYAREQARIKADSVIDRELEKRIDDASARIQVEFQNLVGAEIQATMDEMEGLMEEINRLRPPEARAAEKIAQPEARSKAAGDVAAEREAQWQTMRDALLDYKFTWRSIERLAKAANTTIQVAQSILQDHADEVQISRGKSGRTIARHRSRQPA